MSESTPRSFVAVEYGLITALLSVMVPVTALGTVNTTFNALMTTGSPVRRDRNRDETLAQQLGEDATKKRPHRPL